MKPRQRASRWGLGLTGLVLVALGALVALPERLDLELGAHRFEVSRPRGFEAVAQDRAFLFRDGAVMVELRDLGRPGAYPLVDPQGGPGGDGPLDEWVDWGLRSIDPPGQRELARRDSLTLQARESQVVETWDSLTHAQPRRFVFIRNQGSLLALHTRGGDHDRAVAALERILESLRFSGSGPPPVAQGER